MKFYLTPQNGRVLLSLVKNAGNSFVGHLSSKHLPSKEEILHGTKFDFTPGQFEANPVFQRVLNDTLASHVYESEIQQALAKHFDSGYFNINDQRTPLNWGRTADPEDILGTVLVRNGQMVPNTFEAMPTHRLYTINGFFQLEPFLLEKLILKLKAAK
jgi:hypothetical protein